ncbi:MAG: hypothetical protein ACRCYZ_01010 [Alphaproteobacteria bacterium]
MKNSVLKKFFYTFLLTAVLASTAIACQEDFSGFYAGVTLGQSSGNAENSPE